MIRFLMKHTFKDKYSQCEGVNYYTIDDDLDALEAALKSGGMDDGGYCRNELIGVEVTDDK